MFNLAHFIYWANFFNIIFVLEFIFNFNIYDKKAIFLLKLAEFIHLLLNLHHRINQSKLKMNKLKKILLTLIFFHFSNVFFLMFKLFILFLIFK